MRLLFTAFGFLLLLSFSSCTPCVDGYCDIDCPSYSRTGCLCNDGTTSTATGSGACAGHGGVDCWYCNCD